MKKHLAKLVDWLAAGALIALAGHALHTALSRPLADFLTGELFVDCSVSPVLAVSVYCAAAALIIRTITGWRGSTRPSRALRLVALLVLIAAPMLSQGRYADLNRSETSDARGLSTYAEIRGTIQRHSDIDLIQAWAVKVLCDDDLPPGPGWVERSRGSWKKKYNASGIPKCVRDLRPSSLVVFKGNDKRCVAFHWRTSRGSWDLEVGEPVLNYEDEFSADYMMDVLHVYNNARRWKPGVFIIHGF